MGLEWPWQKNDATGKTHFAEAFYSNREGVFVAGVPLIVNPVTYIPGVTKRGFHDVAQAAAETATGAAQGTVSGVFDGLKKNAGGSLLLIAGGGVLAYLLLRR